MVAVLKTWSEVLRHRPRRSPAIALLVALACGSATGCRLYSKLGDDLRGSEKGLTVFVGGAGAVGSFTGSTSVPRGLRSGGYRGGISVFAWQSVLGGAVRDQIDKGRNVSEARRLAEDLQAYAREHPDKPVNIIALSAGTGITVWALEMLPTDVRVQNVVFLGSSLLRTYDLRRALPALRGKLWNFYSPTDRVLRYAVPIVGSVDRGTIGDTSVAGLYGIVPPRGIGSETQALYRDRVVNMRWRPNYARYGYNGRHTDAVNERFVAAVIAPLIQSNVLRADAEEDPESEVVGDQTEQDGR